MSKLLQDAIDFFGEFLFYSFVVILCAAIGITGVIALVTYLV